MNVACLFNSQHETLGGLYGDVVMGWILKTNTLQNLRRNIRISLGDILSTNPSGAVMNVVDGANDLNMVSDTALRRIVETGDIVYGWLFQNMSRESAGMLHDELGIHGAYIGMISIDFSNQAHLHFIRNSFIEMYRLHNRTLSKFYVLGEDVDIYDCVEDEMCKEYGFKLIYEDIGARGTIFDGYDTLEHFRRVRDFSKSEQTLHDLDEDTISDISFALEELHPKLFDTLAAASRTMTRAETEDDLAQVCLSGRRLIQKIADYLFPARKGKYENMEVGEDKIKNRLLAYIHTTMNKEGLYTYEVWQGYHKRVSELWGFFSAGVHADITKEKTEEHFSKLLLLIRDVINISPTSARLPYLAYTDDMSEFVTKLTRCDIEKSHVIF